MVTSNTCQSLELSCRPVVEVRLDGWVALLLLGALVDLGDRLGGPVVQVDLTNLLLVVVVVGGHCHLRQVGYCLHRVVDRMVV